MANNTDSSDALIGCALAATIILIFLALGVVGMTFNVY